MIRALPLLLLACGHPEVAAGPTSWDEVGPILEARCVGCHQAGQIAPFSMETVEEAAQWAPLIAGDAEARVMPPYLADAGGACQAFTGASWLDPAEIDTLVAWSDAGAPAGGGAPIAAPPVDHLDAPDAVIDIGVDYTPGAEPDDYRCFVVDPGLTQDRFLTAFEVVPGDPRIVHHVILYQLLSDQADAMVADLEALDETPGYTCFGNAVVAEALPIAAWAPGTPTTRMPDQTGLRLPAGRKLVVQVHYNTATGGGTDRTAVRMDLADAVPIEALAYLLADTSMELPAGQAATTHTFDLDLSMLGLPLGVYVRGVFPHMHRRGLSMRLEALRDRGDPDNPEAECMVDVPRWDFDWQQMYWYARPVYLYPDDTLRLTCTYDTSGDADPVGWGEGTADEMCLFGLLVTLS